MNPVDHLTRCDECDETIDPAEMAHQVHEDRCADVDWCWCETVYVHRACCRQCNPPQVPGQVELL